MTSRAYFGTKTGSAQDEAEYLTDQYLHPAVTSVDARLGEGYAKKESSITIYYCFSYCRGASSN